MKRLALLSSAALLFAGAAQAQLDWKSVAGTLGSVAGNAAKMFKGTSEEEERALGAQWAATLLGAAPLVNDAALQQYVNRVGRWVALHSERPNLEWRFGVIDSPNINAFATPGGFVLVTKGLMAQLHDEAELAGVLGHEIAHVVQRHHLKAILKAQGAGLGGKVLGQLASAKGLDADTSAKVLGGLKEVSLRGLDKGDEYQADRMGPVLAARAGYDPLGLPRVLQTLEKLNAQDSSLALLFETHPTPAARLDAIEQSIGEKLDAYAGQPVLAERYRAQVRLR